MSEVMNEKSSRDQVEPAMRTLIAGSCPSLSGASEISFVVACPADSRDVSSICFKIAGNTGKGKYNSNYVSIAAIERALSKIPPEQTFSAAAFNPIYTGRSANSPGFLASILLFVGLITRAPEGQSYVRHTADAFWDEVKGLVGSGVNLQPASMEQGGIPMSSGKSEPVGKKSKKSKPTATTAPVTTAES